MLYHHFKLAYRNFYRNRLFTLINIFGLIIGITSCIFIGLYIHKELSFDEFHESPGHIYRVNKITNEKGGQTQRDGITPGLLAPATAQQIPGVESATRFRPWFNEMLVSYDTTHIKLKDVVFADASFLDLFNFPLLKGDKHAVLSEPYTAVITESTARKYFRDSDPVGRTITTLNNIPVKITGVAKDPPDNSSIQFNLLISWTTITTPANKDNFSWMNNWTTEVVYTFIRLKPNANPDQVIKTISGLMHKYRDETEFQYTPYLQRMNNIHLHSGGILYTGSFRMNNVQIVYALIIVAVFILLIACFNFINLSTAAAVGRAKETGIQKLLGARKSQMIARFLSESFMLCSFAFAGAILVVVILLPYFNRVAGSRFDTGLLLKPGILSGLAGLYLLVGIVAGVYPAFYLSRYKSVDVFRNIVRAGNDKWLRTSFVTTQFTFSILLMIATLIVRDQVRFMRNKDLGFDKEQILVLPLANTSMEEKTGQLVKTLKKYPSIVQISMSNSIPGKDLNGFGIIPEGHRQEEHLLANVLETDADFSSTYKLNIVKGRFFSPEFPTDTSHGIVINEAMVRYLGWKDPIGKQMEIYELKKGNVIGVVKDFNVASLRETVQPLAIVLNMSPQFLSLRLQSGTIPSSLENIKKEWKQINGLYPFDYFFLDEQLNSFYTSDFQLLNVLGIFALVAILVACMGLFGLSIYTAQKRTKEIGIRKTLGASLTGLTFLLSAHFLRLVCIAAGIAVPLAWWAMNKWLENFSYRIHPGFGVFALASLAALLIAWITIIFYTLKAAMSNPVKSLRCE